ncbi:polyprenyl synthetase family protein [Enterococcus asini]|uniref:polyprenyl synthetase family protein n=1 Tax=Enterococcus asini TaxID=57732 RepID=UPI0032BFEA2A
MKLHPLWQEYPTLQSELTETLALMEQTVKLKNKPVEKAVLEMIHAGGKLLRPAYQLLFSRFGPEQDRQKAIALAASIEMLHTATLIHDDIVDKADTRRNLPTVAASFGNDVAVYAGDYLFVCCFKLLADYAGSLHSLQLNSRSMEKILNGELGQMDRRYDQQMTVAEYLDNISGKTAELFALSCTVGALESGTSEKFAKQCGEIGLNIGIAFQIIDDILDYSQPESQIGKPVLEDVRQGVYSLPLLLAMEQNAGAFAPYLDKKADMTDEDTQTVYRLVQEYGGVTKAQKEASRYTQKALKAIRKLPDDEQNTRELLWGLTNQILDRQN